MSGCQVRGPRGHIIRTILQTKVSGSPVSWALKPEYGIFVCSCGGDLICLGVEKHDTLTEAASCGGGGGCRRKAYLLKTVSEI